MTTQILAARRARGFRAASVLKLIGLAFQLHASRRQLASLDAAQLEDIGMTAAQANREAARPVWDVPTNWLN